MIIRGCGTALVTPFRDGKVDFEAYGKMVQAGIDFLVPLGSTAETPCLEDDEKVELLRIARELCPDKPVVVGVGTNSPVATVRNIRLLEPLGPDAYLVVVPYYNKPTQEGIYRYFAHVAEATSKGIVAYNVPGRTGTNMKASTTLRVATIPNVIAVKEASGDLAQVKDVIDGRPEGFSVLSGNDDQTLQIISDGGDGVISVASNLAPGLMEEFVSAALGGDLAKAAELDKKLMPLYDGCFVESNPIPAEMRLPLTEAVPSTFDAMKRILADLD